MLNQRNQTLDAVKGFLILIVIAGHTIQYGSGDVYLSSGSFFENTWFKAIYSFHMPLFMAISGYLYFGTIMKNSWPEFLKKISFSILTPLLVWNSATLLSLSLFKAISNEPLIYLELLQGLILGNWFLGALIACAVAQKTLETLRISFSFSLAITALLSWITTDSYNLQLIKFTLPFFIIGFALRKNDVDLTSILASRPHFVVAVVCWGFLVFSMNSETYIYNSGFNFNTGFLDLEQLVVNSHRFVLGILGCAIVLRGFNNFRVGASSTVLIACGKNTLGIYLISGLLTSFALTRLPVVDAPEVVVFIVQFIFVASASYIGTIAISKIGFLRKILLGGR
jgi:fucose 4-O-acetylase-like acetyltransferase